MDIGDGLGLVWDMGGSSYSKESFKYRIYSGALMVAVVLLCGA